MADGGEKERFILYDVEDAVAWITLDRAEARNAQNALLLAQLDDAFARAAAAPEVRVVVLKANGPHFSAGHDISPKNSRAMVGKIDWTDGVASHYAWEKTNYLDMSRRWRNLPKPTIAAVQGRCIAGGLMLCWPCDLIVASDDALFSDPVARMGIGGVEYHGHTWELGARKAKEMLFTGGAIEAVEAHRLGMVNRVVASHSLLAETRGLAATIAAMDPFALRMAKEAVNRTLDEMGQWTAMQAVFDMHHLAHAHSRLRNGGHSYGGQTVDSMKAGIASS